MSAPSPLLRSLCLRTFAGRRPGAASDKKPRSTGESIVASDSRKRHVRWRYLRKMAAFGGLIRVRELYLRRDVGCGSEACVLCAAHATAIAENSRFVGRNAAWLCETERMRRGAARPVAPLRFFLRFRVCGRAARRLLSRTASHYVLLDVDIVVFVRSSEAPPLDRSAVRLRNS